MNETPQLLMAALELAKGFIWPALIVWIVLRFHHELRALFSRLVSLKVGSTEWVFGRVESLQAELRQTNAVVSKLGEQSGDPVVSNAAKSLPKPDGNMVANWAKEHGADNPWDMGPKNWERCLHDLGHPGGKPHELEMENGKLKYQ